MPGSRSCKLRAGRSMPAGMDTALVGSVQVSGVLPCVGMDSPCVGRVIPLGLNPLKGKKAGEFFRLSKKKICWGFFTIYEL